MLLGFIEVDGILWSQGTAWLGIGIGDRDNWGKGIGAEVHAPGPEIRLR